jgi:hypothetical protein
MRQGIMGIAFMLILILTSGKVAAQVSPCMVFDARPSRQHPHAFRRVLPVPVAPAITPVAKRHWMIRPWRDWKLLAFTIGTMGSAAAAFHQRWVAPLSGLSGDQLSVRLPTIR